MTQELNTLLSLVAQTVCTGMTYEAQLGSPYPKQNVLSELL